MYHATLLYARFGGAGRFLGHLAHGGLLTAGLVALLVFVAGQLEGRGGFARHEGVVSSAHAADQMPTVELPEIDHVASDDSSAQGEVQPALSREMNRVLGYVAKRYRVSRVALEPLLAQAEVTGRQLGLDPMLLVAMIAIESSFNPFAESSVGAQGLMQVIPRYHMDKIGDDAGDDALFDPTLNIRVGALVLKEGLSRFGKLQTALQYYGGALDDPNAGYAGKVFAMQARLKQAAGRGGAA